MDDADQPTQADYESAAWLRAAVRAFLHRASRPPGTRASPPSASFCYQ